MPPPSVTPAMREFGFGAKRVLQPYQNPEAKDFFRVFRPSQEELDSPFLSSPYARQQDALVAQEDMVNQQLAAEQAQMMADQRKAARLEQVYEAEDLANEALASGVPPDEVIQRFPRLAQSPSFSNYMQQAREVRPAQKTLAPHFRGMFKTAEERADFDEAMNQFGDVTRADDYARAKAAERGLRVELIDAGVPLEVLEKAGPLTGEKAAILKRQHKIASTNGDPLAMKGYEEWLRMRVAGDPEGAEVLRKDLEAQGINIFPPKVASTPAPVTSPAPASVTAVAPSAAPPAAQENIFEDEEDFASPEKVAEVKRAKIGAPDVDENFYSAFIASPNNSIADKRAALEKFKEFVSNPPPKKGLTLGEALKRQDTLKESLQKAEEDLEVGEVVERVVKPAWTDAKLQLERAVESTAARLGVLPQQIYNSISQGEKVETGPNRFDPVEAVVLHDAGMIGNLRDNLSTNPFLEQAVSKLTAAKAKHRPVGALWEQITGQLGTTSNFDVLKVLAGEKAEKNATRAAPAEGSGLPRVSSPEEARKLPKGTRFISPDGTVRQVP